MHMCVMVTSDNQQICHPMHSSSGESFGKPLFGLVRNTQCLTVTAVTLLSNRTMPVPPLPHPSALPSTVPDIETVGC